MPFARAFHAAVAAAACGLLPLAPLAAQQDGGLPPPPQVVGVAVPEGQIEAAIAQLDERATALLERSAIPGLAVAVVRGGETVYAKGFGVRKAGEDASVDPDTVFQLASVSKSLGATVVAHQVGASSLEWTTPVSDLLPWFDLADDWVSQHLTIADLYAHRSGLPDHAGDDLEDLGYDRRQVLERLDLLPLHPFRSHYAYTNFGLTAAAEATAAAAGRDWAELSQEVLYEPLGMTATSSRHADLEARENRAYGHVPGDNGYEVGPQRQPDAQSPAGGVSSSVNDMAKWMAMVLQDGRFGDQEIIPAEALLPAVTAQVISAPSYAADARPSFYGYGFNVTIQPSGRVTLGHSGGFALGAGTAFLLIPSLDLGIVALTNAPPIGVAETLTTEFADLVQYGEVTRDWFPAYHGLMAPLVAPVGELVGQERPAPTPVPAPLTAYAGRYANDYFGEARVEQEGEQLLLVLGPDEQQFQLDHWENDTFTFSPFNENAPKGSVSAVTFQRDGERAESMTVELLDEYGWGTFHRSQ